MDLLFVETIGLGRLAITIAVLAVSILLWTNGFRLARMLITAIFFAIGTTVAAHVGAKSGVNIILSALIGGIICAGLGYWLFILWLSITSGVVFGVIISVVLSWQFTYPYIEATRSYVNFTASQPFNTKTDKKNIKTDKKEDIQNHQKTTPVKDKSSPRKVLLQGKTNKDNTKALISRLNPTEYSSQEEWKEELSLVIREIRERILATISQFRLMYTFSIIAGFIIAIVLAMTNPISLNIFLTSIIGTMGIFACVVFLAIINGRIEDIPYTANVGILLAIAAIVSIIGAATQYYLMPEPEEEEEEKEEKAKKEEKQG